jgi:hypothetical protein
MIWSEYAAQMHTLLTKVKLCSRFSASASKVQYYGDHSRVSVGQQSALNKVQDTSHDQDQVVYHAATN